ncbi:cell division ATP-binding protein FtsE [Candidatus Dojkabacteria bacterium]|uniref:Cell division ATP-binding protein FtsE n=1 Tax=Candidatus Dojkabacteria bacterium TaxID=2099670 RepID=A0A955L6U4_9BACT|nr:cell division ATP-binding protein FtsE [Candidatus Dojkabacteria bacterium]
MIQYDKISKYYKDMVALDDVSLQIDEGEFVMLTGHSGSGKTTLIKMLIREIRPTKGEIHVDGSEITRMRRWNVAKLRRKIGIVFQDFRLLDDKNVFENVAFALEASGKSDKDIKNIVPYVLEIVGLEDKLKSFPYELSGGQKQKVAIARAIANDPKILIADEPTGNLDEEATWDIIEALKNINNWGTTVIMATHSQDIIDKLEKRILKLEQGRLIHDSHNKSKQSSDDFAEKLLQDDSTIEDKKQEEKQIEPETKDEAPTEKSSLKNEKSSKQDKQTDTTPPKKESSKPKLKIGLSSKKKKSTKKKSIEEKKEESSKKKDSEESKDPNDFESTGLKPGTIALLTKNNYKNMQDVLDAGPETIKMIDGISGDQILELNEAIQDITS